MSTKRAVEDHRHTAGPRETVLTYRTSGEDTAILDVVGVVGMKVESSRMERSHFELEYKADAFESDGRESL